MIEREAKVAVIGVGVSRGIYRLREKVSWMETVFVVFNQHANCAMSSDMPRIYVLTKTPPLTGIGNVVLEHTFSI